MVGVFGARTCTCDSIVEFMLRAATIGIGIGCSSSIVAINFASSRSSSVTARGAGTGCGAVRGTCAKFGHGCAPLVRTAAAVFICLAPFPSSFFL